MLPSVAQIRPCSPRGAGGAKGQGPPDLQNANFECGFFRVKFHASDRRRYSGYNFPYTHIARLKTQIQHKAHIRTTKDENKKWATFTYHSPKVRKLTNLFQHTNIKIAFKSTNTIQQSIKPKNHPQNIPDYNRSGVYKLTCKTCNISYIGQTSRDLTHRCREHIRYIRNDDPQSAYAQHILRNQHEYGTVTDFMILLKPIHKTSWLIPYEQLFIQTYQYNSTLITEQNGGEQNPLFHLAIDTGLTSQLFHNK